MRRELQLKQELFEEELKRMLAEENLRISRELHDNIGSQLTFLINSLDNFTYVELNTEIKNKIKNISSFARKTLNDLRNTVWAIRTGSNELTSLIIRINDYINRYRISVGNLEFQVKDNTKNSHALSSTQLLNLFRIFQESLQNTMKHANASQYVLSFDDVENGFIMKIEDNGIGIDLDNFSESTSGMVSMKYRCQDAGGIFSIFNRVDGESGTVIECLIATNK